ncbi:MAG: nucleotide exchange factor GrpE [Methanothrix sp.]
MTDDKNSRENGKTSEKSESRAQDKMQEAATEEHVPKSEYEAIKERMLRLAAEFDNYKKRSASDVANAKNIGKAEMLKRMLPVLDEFELAMISSAQSQDENLSKGVKMVYANMMDALKAEGLSELEPNGKYDPYTDEIIMVKETDKEPGTVLEVLKKGYKMNGILVRPASVIISKGPRSETDQVSEETQEIQKDEENKNGK